MYGVVNYKGEHIDVSISLLGAKQYATRNGYNRVSKRNGYNIIREYRKEGNKWIRLY